MAHRLTSYGEASALTIVDKFGHWLSTRRIMKISGSLAGKDVADLGCGYHASLSALHLNSVRSLFLIDVRLSPELRAHPKVKAKEALIPDGLKELADQQFDLILCNNVIEHLFEPQETLQQCRRLLRHGGKIFINVPSWRGKYFLELAAFKLDASINAARKPIELSVSRFDPL